MKRFILSSSFRALVLQLTLGTAVSLLAVAVLARWIDSAMFSVLALGFVPLVVAAYRLGRRRSQFAPGGFVGARVLVLVPFGYLFMDVDAVAVGIIVVEVGLIAVETVVSKINFYVASARQQFNPRYRSLVLAHQRTKGLPTFASFLVIIAGVVALNIPGWAAAIVGVATGVHFLALTVMALRLFTIRRLPKVARPEITPYDVMLHFSGSPSSLYQLTMWLPVFATMKLRTLVIIRDSSTLLDLFDLLPADLVFLKRPQDLDKVVSATWSASVACYVNSAPANAHLVRFRELTHVQLNHGDSEKGPSSSKVMRMFDANFVAGNAAISRFAEAGIAVPEDYFHIVGRPQLAGLNRITTTAPIATVLYAPTWRGSHSDANYSSLAAAETVVHTLIEAGLTVIFRPHPFSRDSSRDSAIISNVESMLAFARSDTTPHVFGEVPQRTMSITDAFNSADALVADVSSVSSDFLFTGKPQVVVVNSEASDEDSIERLAGGAYIVKLGESLSAELAQALGDMRTTDSTRTAREKVAHDVLGPVSDPQYFSLFERELTALVSERNQSEKKSGE